MKRILLVDDAKDVHITLKPSFEHDFILTSAYTLAEATKLLSQSKFDLILLDVMLPDGDGFHFYANLISHPGAKKIPVIFLTGKKDFSHKVMGFSLGAEDYIVKPFNPHEVKLICDIRLNKMIEKNKKNNRLAIKDLYFDLASHRVFLRTEKGDTELLLTPIGFKLLLYLAKHEGQVFSRDQLISAVWGEGTYIIDRTVDSHIGALRKQLVDSSVVIEAVHGVGYKLAA